MSDIAIRVENLGKMYRIGRARERRDTLRDALMAGLRAPWERLRGDDRREEETFWALKDVSFEVKRGEAMGVIGRNGAGKSTLLKILSRITEPTTGRAEIHGRVASLLEVGTGFHPELTGRDNIYLSGATLGMKRADIARRFDEIVAFSEVERFLDTPVKRYSSGMYVRLAFAVAAHLEPEVLLVDEVLAVGDMMFQRKCLQRMQHLTEGGVTILFISHNMAAIQGACRVAVLMDGGQVVAKGNPISVIEEFQRLAQNESPRQALQAKDLNIEECSQVPVRITGFAMYAEDGTLTRTLRFGEAPSVRIDLLAHEKVCAPAIQLGVRRSDGVKICSYSNWHDGFKIEYIEGECHLYGRLPPLRLIPGLYEIHVLVWPWGAGHLGDALEQTQPYVWEQFGYFQVIGIGLNEHDGVFQIPAMHWALTSDSGVLSSGDIPEDAIHGAFTPPG
ncbi:MAG: ABC transporter ATP-binding protein [Chloroflexi bacterium]|nr:ABC transporter ATP-binding protein [Chloroflexota bacterium]